VTSAGILRGGAGRTTGHPAWAGAGDWCQSLIT
jgi:hypothetical protein